MHTPEHNPQNINLARHANGLYGVILQMRRESTRAVKENRSINEFEIDQLIDAASVLAYTLAEELDTLVGAG